MEFVSYNIASNDFRRAGAASRSIKEHLKRIGADAEAIRRTVIAAYEAEMNVVIHSVGGRLEASLSDSQIDVSVVDHGPGIPDVEQAMAEGYSTASPEARALGFGAGMGLPNIKRNADRLRITSRVNEGTRVSFTVYLKPERTAAPRLISLHASPDRCRDCKACLRACPTQALRIREGRPSVLEHLCVDCAECIAACAAGALTMREDISSLDDIEDREQMLLVVPPALLSSCGADYPPAQVLTTLRELGFAGVLTSAPYEEVLKKAAAAAFGGAAGPAEMPSALRVTGDDIDLDSGRMPPEASPTPLRRPVIVPSCPAVVNLIELRFPSLVPHLAPFASPWEAVQATCGERPVAYVVSCPSQRSALVQLEGTRGGGAGAAANESAPEDAPTVTSAPAEYISPEVVRQAVLLRLTSKRRGNIDGQTGPSGTATPLATAAPGAHHLVAPAADTIRLLTVTGMNHVIAVLEEVENGLLFDVDVIDPYSCEGSCFGSPLLPEDHHVAAHRWKQDQPAVEAVTRSLAGSPVSGPVPTPDSAVARQQPVAPRPGIRLDADMSRAIQKLGRMQALIRLLPGRDCGMCGAPTCAALAEDIVMDRADLALCPYVTQPDNAREVPDP